MHIATHDQEPRRGQRDDLTRRMDAQLRNWALWACGKLGIENSHSPKLADPIIADAEAVEAELLVMKRNRPRYFQAVMLRYRNRWMDETCSEAMRCSVPTYRQVMRLAYAWLDGRLCERI